MTSNEEVEGLLAELQGESEAILTQIFEISWHMRSWTREEVWALSYKERERAMKYIDERVKLVKETGLPLL